MIREIFKILDKNKINDDNFVFAPQYKKIFSHDKIIKFNTTVDDNKIREDRKIDFCFKLKDDSTPWYENAAIDTWNINTFKDIVSRTDNVYPGWWSMNDPSTWYRRDMCDHNLLTKHDDWINV